MNQPDDSLLCPITLQVFQDPVVAQDGHTYERRAIQEWIEKNGRSPITDQPLSSENLYSNHAIKKAVDHFETSLKKKNYRHTLNVDVKKKSGRPLFQSFGKTIFYADWLPTSNNRPEIILLKIDGARARKEASFYVELSRHPHIVRTYGLVYEENDDNDVDTNESNAILLLQEHAPMGSLYDLLQERRKVPNEKILVEIFLQIIDAMVFLAHNNVVHADLACRNVLVFRFDENNARNNLVKVTDFGLSRHSKLYSLAPCAARTILNIIPVRYVAPEILSPNTKPEDYTEKSDVYSMGILMWEAYSRGAIPWAKINDDNDVIRRVINGEYLPKPANCSESYWSIICKTWSKLLKDRPTFAELKHLLTQEYYGAIPEALNNGPLTLLVSKSSDEFKSIENDFLNGWPSELRREIQVDAIYKINNPLLESRYQQFVRSNPKYAVRECIGWHGTSTKCHNGTCMSIGCSLCQVIRNGFDKDCARKNTSSYRCWGAATYFANKSFVCHTYNGASQTENGVLKRCTIMTKINHGRILQHEKLTNINNGFAYLPELIQYFKCDTVRFSRDYYIAPVDYILVYNNIAALPVNIIEYSYKTNDLKIREKKGDYCQFHNEYHLCSTHCDGHYMQMCLSWEGTKDQKNVYFPEQEHLYRLRSNESYEKFRNILDL